MRIWSLLASLMLAPSVVLAQSPDALAGRWVVARFSDPELVDTTSVLPGLDLAFAPLELTMTPTGTAEVVWLVPTRDGYERTATPATVAVDGTALVLTVSDDDPEATPWRIPLTWATDGDALVLRTRDTVVRLVRG